MSIGIEMDDPKEVENMTLYKRAISTVEKDDEKYFEKIMELTDIFLKLKEMDEVEDIEDIREGPFSGVSLADAVNKLMFELKNDPGLYKGYKDNLSRVIYDRMVKDTYFEGEKVPSVIEEGLKEIADDSAKNFWDEYISLINE